MATNVSQETVTLSAGTYSAPFLIPGLYQVTVAGQGFSTQVVGGVAVAVGKYEGLRTCSTSTAFGIVPTLDELNGVFSNTIIDPDTGLPYPNNTIPQSDFSTFGLSAVNHFPSPNVDLPQGNYRYTARIRASADQQTYRVDHSIGTRHNLFGRYTQTRYTLVSSAITEEGATHQV